jgi:hypothetical protein
VDVNAMIRRKQVITVKVETDLIETLDFFKCKLNVIPINNPR